MNEYHLLVVDDELNRCKMLDYKLRKAGYKVSFTTSPVKSIDIFKSENIDLVITDIRMGEMGGIQLIKELKNIDPLINVILITAYGKDINLLHSALRCGAFEFLEKIDDIDILLNIIEKAIHDRKMKQNYTFYKEKYIESKENILIGEDEKIKNIKEIIKSVAPTDSTVLITGESGTGKEIVARMLHDQSTRRNENFVIVNCAAINENLLESELFGHKKGSFTGAYTNKDGLFKVAHKGTIFLDEIAEMPASMQVKLLRVIQEKEITPIGSVETIPVDVRIITATNKIIEQEIDENRFRSDLFYRINVIRIDMPSLRERRNDIKILFDHYIAEYAKKYGKKIDLINDNVYKKLINYDWPGNVRELINIIERILVIKSDGHISAKDILINDSIKLSRTGSKEIDDESICSLEKMEQQMIRKALSSVNGDKKKAAEILGVNVSTLYRKMKKYEE